MADRGSPEGASGRRRPSPDRRPAASGTGPGHLVLVVGPSGAGKDSLIRTARERLAGDYRVSFPRRIVTRPASPAEDNVEIDPARFAELRAAGGLAVAWRAHGHDYGLPVAIDAAVLEGRTVVCNVSRTVLPELRGRYRRALVVAVTAPPDVLARRLAGRGRDGDGDLGLRLARTAAVGVTDADHAIDNSGDLADAAERFVGLLLATLDASLDAPSLPDEAGQASSRASTA